MKTVALVLVALVSGCASAPTPAVQEPVSTSQSSALTVADAKAKPAALASEKGDAKPVAPVLAKTEGAKSMDPLAMDSAFEASSVPAVVLTPKKDLRGKSRGDLAATQAMLQKDATVEVAVKHAEARLGKPTWIEGGTKRVWVADGAKECHRLVLSADGSVDLETMQKTERTMLSALARQNPCTGEIERGVQ